MIRNFAILSVCVVACVAFPGCSGRPSSGQPASTAGAPAGAEDQTSGEEFPELLQTRHLPNAVRIHDKVISGGLPEGDEAFQELVRLGVKTVIRVDGAKPDVAAARKAGLRYVHLPHGYNGISAERSLELAKAVRELEGVIYIHCHHGKHRSPAAASVACVTAGMLAPARGISVLELAGTSPGYLGLFQSVQDAQPLAPGTLDALQIEFQESVAVPPMADAMVLMEHTFDHLKAIQQAGWKTPADHPDLDPAHVALLLQEHFSELLRTEEVQQHTEEFRAILRSSEQASRNLHRGLEKSSRLSGSSPPFAEFEKLAGQIGADCKSCHQTFRDRPLQR